MPVHDTVLDNADFKITDLKSLLITKDENNFMSHLELLRILFFRLNKLIDVDDLKLIEEIHIAQLESLKQKKPETSIGEIEQILRQKGGLTAILYAQIVNHEFSRKDKELLIECGYWVQLFDDLMDYKKDTNEGVRTLANQLSIEEFARLIDRQRNLVAEKLRKTQYPENRKFNFMFSIYYFEKLSNAYFQKISARNSYPTSGIGEIFNLFSSLLLIIPDLMKFEFDLAKEVQVQNEVRELGDD
jgi:hypothetical protein